MNPAMSVVLLTTLIGAGQGLFLVLAALSLGARFELWAPAPDGFVLLGSALSLALLVAGLGASFFHLGRPERAWRSAAQWRTSWLSREVIVLPAVMALVLLFGLAHHPLGAAVREVAPWIGAAGALASLALFVCTGMIYACLRFLQEWASPLTVINFTLLGLASGVSIAAALAAYRLPVAAVPLAQAALVLTVAAFAGRWASLARNRRLRPKSTLATAIGVKHPRIEQRAAGFLGGSFNTREFFHGRSRGFMRAVRGGFIVAAFFAPVSLLAIGLAAAIAPLVVLAAVVQLAGLLAERWYFFAEANHPQNLYYRAIG